MPVNQEPLGIFFFYHVFPSFKIKPNSCAISKEILLSFTSNFYFNTATWKYTFHTHTPTKQFMFTRPCCSLPDHLGKEFHGLTFFEINKKVYNCNIRIICHTNISYYSYWNSCGKTGTSKTMKTSSYIRLWV